MKHLFNLLCIALPCSTYPSYCQPTGKDLGNYNSDYNRNRRESQKTYEKQADLNRQPASPGSSTKSVVPFGNSHTAGKSLETIAAERAAAGRRADEYKDELYKGRLKSYEYATEKIPKITANYDALYIATLSVGFNPKEANELILPYKPAPVNEAVRHKVTLNFPNGDSYIGESQHGKMNGYGTYYFKSGAYYIGTMANDKMNGSGTYYFKTGQRIVGNFINGVADADALHYDAAGKQMEVTR